MTIPESPTPITRNKTSPGGVYWGKAFPVLVRAGEKELWMLPSGSWRGEYIPGRLLLVENAGAYYNRGTGTFIVLAEGGRVSAKLFAREASKINAFFGVEIAHLLNQKTSLVIS